MPQKKPTIAPRKPPALTSAAAFVSSGAIGPQRRDVSEHKGATTYYTRKSDGEALRRFSMYLPASLARRLGGRCAEEDRAVSDALAEADGAWLRGS